MPVSEKNRLASDGAERYGVFEEALFRETTALSASSIQIFLGTGMRDAEPTRSDPLIHRKVVEVVHSFTDMVGVGRKRIPENVPWDAERLEGLVFRGYRYFEGDELPKI